MRVNVGDIILAQYLDFNNEIKTGMFLVYFHDCDILSGSQSFNTLKVCTKPNLFQVKLDSNFFKFLTYDSYVSCTCQQRFHESQVLNILGRVTSRTMQTIETQLKQFNKEIDKQIEAFSERQNTLHSISYSNNPHNVNNK